MKFTSVDVEKRRALDIRPGDTVRVWQRIQEKDKTRLQAFEGLLIARKHGREDGATFTVRKIASGVGVEKIFFLYSPFIDKIEVMRRAKVRRAKLYYIRTKAAKQIRKKMKGLAEFVPTAYQEGEEKSEEGDNDQKQEEKKQAEQEEKGEA